MISEKKQINNNLLIKKNNKILNYFFLKRRKIFLLYFFFNKKLFSIYYLKKKYIKNFFFFLYNKIFNIKAFFFKYLTIQINLYFNYFFYKNFKINKIKKYKYLYWILHKHIINNICKKKITNKLLFNTNNIINFDSQYLNLDELNNNKNYFFHIFIKKYYINKIIFSKFYFLYFANIFYNMLMKHGKKIKIIKTFQNNFQLLKLFFKEFNYFTYSRFNYYLWYLLFKFQIFFYFKKEQKSRKRFVIITKIINFNKQYAKGLKLFFWLFKQQKKWNKKLQFKFFLFFELYNLKLKQITLHIDYLNIFSFLINRYKHFIQKKINFIN